MAYIIFGVVFISFCIWIYDLKKTESMTWDYYDIISAIFSSIGSSLLISFIITIPICLVMTEVYSESKYKNKTEKWNIVTLKDNNNTKGNFEMILGTGSGQVTQGLRYSTYIEKGNEIKLLTVDTDDAELKYTDDKPYVIITKQYKKN